MKSFFAFSAMALLLVSGSALAETKFEAMDTDKNGALSWEEFSTALPGMQRAAYDTIDSDKKDGISNAEWDEFSKGHSKGMGMGKGMPADGKKGMPMIMPPEKAQPK